MSNVLQAGFYRRRAIDGLQRVTVRQKFSNHTIAFLDYKFDNHRDYLLPPENTPTTIRWGSGPSGVRTTYGYINHYETTAGEQGEALTRMVLVGTSKKMNAVNTSTWQGQSYSAVARDIVTRHRLRSVIHDHPFVLENWATGTRSDFQSLKALADEVGYVLWVDGSTAYFLDPTRVFQDASSMSTPRVKNQVIRKAQVLGGSNIPGEMRSSSRRVQYGLDLRTNEFFTATSGDITHPTEVTTATVNTFSEAQQVADAAERKQREYYVLKATLDGNAALYPGAVVQVESGRVNRDQEGLWLTTEATHEITTTDFETQIVATRGADQFPAMRVRSTVRGASGLMPAVVRDGVTWEAALQEHIHA